MRFKLRNKFKFLCRAEVLHDAILRQKNECADFIEDYDIDYTKKDFIEEIQVERKWSGAGG